jgi:hypothetical protein
LVTKNLWAVCEPSLSAKAQLTHFVKVDNVSLMPEKNEPAQQEQKTTTEPPKDLPDPDPQVLERGIPPGDIEKRKK